VVAVTAWCVYHEDHHAVPEPQGLQAHLAIGIAPILAGDREACKHGVAADEIEPVGADIRFALGFVIGQHQQIVDALLRQVEPECRSHPGSWTKPHAPRKQSGGNEPQRDAEANARAHGWAVDYHNPRAALC